MMQPHKTSSRSRLLRSPMPPALASQEPPKNRGETPPFSRSLTCVVISCVRHSQRQHVTLRGGKQGKAISSLRGMCAPYDRAAWPGTGHARYARVKALVPSASAAQAAACSHTQGPCRAGRRQHVPSTRAAAAQGHSSNCLVWPPAQAQARRSRCSRHRVRLRRLEGAGQPRERNLSEQGHAFESAAPAQQRQGARGGMGTRMGGRYLRLPFVVHSRSGRAGTGPRERGPLVQWETPPLLTVVPAQQGSGW